ALIACSSLFLVAPLQNVTLDHQFSFTALSRRTNIPIALTDKPKGEGKADASGLFTSTISYCFISTRISSTSVNCSPEWVTGGMICASSFFVSTSRVVPSAKVYLDFPPLMKYTTKGG